MTTRSAKGGDGKTEAGPKAMDPGAREIAGPGRPLVNRQRNAYALDTLVTEVLELFPETEVTYSNYTGRNVALTGTFMVTVEANNGELAELLGQLAGDARISRADWDSVAGAMVVEFNKNARTQDSREPFGVGEAFLTLVDEDGSL